MVQKKEFGVFGLGDFGKSIAMTLAQSGCQVMAVDMNAERVQEASDYVTMAVRADVTDTAAMSALGIGNLDVVVIAIGNSLEASVMAAIAAKEAGVPYVLAKVRSKAHATVLKKMGVDQVVFPEEAMGIRIARSLVSGNFVDIIEMSSEFSIVEVKIPQEWEGKTLRELAIRQYNLNIIARKDNQNIDMKINPDRPLKAGETYVIAGDNKSLERLR